MENRPPAIFVVCVIAIAGLYIVGYCFPSHLTWGMHFLAFLPAWVLALYGVLVTSFLVILRRNIVVRQLSRAGKYMDESPYEFLAIAAGIFVVVAVILRVKAPLLGDGFFLVKNYSDALSGAAEVDPRNEFLSTWYFYGIVHLFGTSTYAGFLNAFLFGGIILGVGFMIVSFFIVKELLDAPEDRLLAFLLIVSLSSMQLFFGYVETYGVVLFALSVYVLSAIFTVKGKISLLIVFLSFIFMLSCHLLSLILLPSLLYLVYFEWKTKGRKPVLQALGVAIFVLSILMVALNFRLDRLTAWVPHNRYLSLSTPTDPAEQYSQPYTLFSLYHMIDLGNLVFLLCAPAFVLTVVTKPSQLKSKSPIGMFFRLGIFSAAASLAIIKFDLGAARDWDVFAPYAFLPVLAAVWMFLRDPSIEKKEITLIVVFVTLVSSTAFFGLNATKEPSVQRYKSLVNTSTLSNLAYYGATLQLSAYYHQVRDSLGPVQAWQQYVGAFSTDARGYQNLIRNMKALRVMDTDQIADVYRRWTTINPQDTLALMEYSRLCLDGGNASYSRGDLVKAATYYQKAISLDPFRERAYNNLGSVYAQQGKTAEAIELFQKAIDLNPEYSDPYYNMGSAYDDTGNRTKSLALTKKAAQMGNVAAQTQLKQKGVAW